MTTAATTNPQDAKMAATSENPQDVKLGLSKLAVGAAPEPHPELNGYLLKLPNTDPIYLILDGYRCHVPDFPTFQNLFRDGAAVFQEPLLNVVAQGPTLSQGALLVRSDVTKDAKVYLLSNGVKRWIPNPEIFNLYQFNAARIVSLPVIVINSIPTGPDIPKRA